MDNTYIEHERKLDNGKILKTFKGYTICPDCKSKFELETTEPKLFGVAKCLECFKQNERIKNDPIDNSNENQF